MYNKHLILIAILWLACPSCKNKDNAVYEGCCGAEATRDTYTFNLMVPGNSGQMIDSTFKAGVYIPNIMVVGSMGADDNLIVFGSDAINKVNTFVCTDQQGNTLFSTNNVLPNDLSKGWNGVKPDGTPYKGVFNYHVVVEFINGQQKTYDGESCVFYCGEDGFPHANLPKCFFPTQHDGNGGQDPNIAAPLFCF